MTARPSVRALLLCSAASLLSALPLHAQETEDAILLAPITVQSKRTVQTDTAASTTVVDQEEIADRQTSTVAELVESAPGVTVVGASTPLSSGINIRGFGPTSSYGTDNHVGVQIAGVSKGADELYRMGTQLFTDPALFREVTVTRGLAGTLEYGSGLFGGLVQMEPIQAGDMTGGEPGFKYRQLLEYGSNNYWASASTFAWQPNESIEILGNYTYRDVGIIKDGNGDDINDEGYDEQSWLLNSRFTFGDSNEHQLKLLYQHTESTELNTPYDGLNGFTFFGYVDRYTEDDTVALTYEYTSPTSDLVDIEATFSYSDLYIDNDLVSGTDYGFNNTGYTTKTTQFRVTNTARFATGVLDHNLRTGLEFTHAHRTTDDVVSSAPQGEEDIAALFIADDIVLGGLTLTPEVRLESQSVDGTDYGYDSYDNTGASAGISAIYAFNNGFSLLGTAFYGENLPIIDDLDNASYMTLEEKATEIQLGLSYDGANLISQGDALAFKAVVYDQHYWDMTSIISDVVGGDTWGLELEAAYSMASGFYVDANANFMRSRTVTSTGTRAWSERAPADEVRVTLGKKFGKELDLSYEAVFVDDMGRSSDPSDGYTLHNLRATWTPQDGTFKGTEVRFGIENVADTYYEPHLSSEAGAGRTFKVSLAKTF